MQLLGRPEGLTAATSSAPTDTAVVTTGDGCTLATDVHLPHASHRRGRVTTVLLRTPYGRRGEVDRIAELAPALTAAGLALVVQDVRGRADSAGRARPFLQELADGAATVEWIIAQQWSDGVVIPYGDSYPGFCAIAAAAGGHPAVAGVVARVTTTSIVSDWFRSSDALRLQLSLPWLEFAFGNQHFVQSPPLWDPSNLAVDVAHLSPALRDDWLGRAPQDPLWRESRLDGPHISSQVQVPILHWTSWWDLMLRGQLADYTTRAALGRPDGLIIDSADHEMNPLGPSGSDIARVAQLAEVIADFAQRVVSGGAPAAPRITLAHHRHRDGASPWPARTYLVDGSRATLGPEGGSLGARADPLPYPAVWVDDPRDPVPSLENFPWGVLKEGLPDESAIHLREDVITFTAAEVRTPTVLDGTLRATLTVKNSDRPSHLVVTVCDVWPDGHASRIAHGVTVLDASAEWRPVTVDIGAVGYVLRPGHRLRVSVAASSFPRHPPAVPDSPTWWQSELPAPQTVAVLVGPSTHLDLDGSVITGNVAVAATEGAP